MVEMFVLLPFLNVDSTSDPDSYPPSHIPLMSSPRRVWSLIVLLISDEKTPILLESFHQLQTIP